ncbi:unnamed protein product [Paramecium sonneborni]|uniref:Uncharacterized protein n=1 Tax=Paramecium sonneborni TaxID=65129 RepID=A0A8S1LQP1_9CILI|nr:unnamed protein product [Paramecium sonneborni]
MQLTPGAIDFISTGQSIPLFVQILNVIEIQRFESFTQQKCEIYDGIKSKEIFLISKNSLNQQFVKEQKPIIQIEDFKLENSFIVVRKYKEISHISYLEVNIKYEEELQDQNEPKLTKFSDFVKDNYYNIKAIVQNIEEKKTVKDIPYLIFTLSDSFSSISTKCLIFINEAGIEAYLQFKNQLEQGIEYIFQNVKIDTYKNQNRIYFNSNTKIQIAPLLIQWIKFNDIQFHMIGKSCNMVGYVYQIKQLKQVSASLILKKIYIFDMNFNKVKIVIWNQLAKTLELSENTIIGFQNLLIKEYQNKIYLQINYKTRMLTNSKNLIQIKNFYEFYIKFQQQYDQIDKRSNFYKMGFTDIQKAISEFKQISNLQFIKYYRIKATIVEFLEITLIPILNKELQFNIILRDKSNINIIVNVNGTKFAKKILDLNEDKHIGQSDFQLKFNKNEFQEAKNKTYDFIIIGQNIEEDNEIKSIFKLVKIISDIQSETYRGGIQKLIKLNEQFVQEEKLNL